MKVNDKQLGLIFFIESLFIEIVFIVTIFYWALCEKNMANNNEIEDWDAEIAHNTGRMRFIRGYWI